VRALLVLWMFGVFSTVKGAAEDPPFFRGMTVSCQTWGGEWATPAMERTLDDLRGMGVTAIAIHPYARIRADGSLQFTQGPAPEHVVKPLRWARARGLRVMLIPHIAYWGSPWLWRGDIDFTSAEEWNRFFTDYEHWITGLAAVAQQERADLFCVGLEYSHAQKFDERWRAIIAAVRRVYAGRLTYGANWNEVRNVTFWDALDYIGVLAYFPLTEATNPSAAEIAHGWNPWLQELETLSRRCGKRVVFTEIGYNENAQCAAQPWDFHRRGGPEAQEIQARCIREALRLEERAPFLAGMFWWKWFPDVPATEAETFDLRKPWTRRVIAEQWK
jgi:hypothetical protein